MLKTTLLNARLRLHSLINKAISTSEPINIVTPNGNAVIISEQDYRNITETLFIENNPKYKNELLKAMREPKSEYVDIDEVCL